MRFNIRNTLASIVVVSAIGLSGCPKYGVSQENVDGVIDLNTKEWVKTTDNYLEFYQLLEKGEYEKAQTMLESYLRQESSNAIQTKEVLQGTDKVSRITAERICKTIDAQVEKIEANLK